MEKPKRQFQTVACGTCNQIFASCWVPECYQDAGWQKDLRKYSAQGAIINIVDKFEFGICECNSKKQPKNQLEMF